MYIPAAFAQSDTAALLRLVREHPLATIVQFQSSANVAMQLEANHIPLIWVDDGSEHGVLRGHVARANSMWQTQPTQAGSNPVLVIFQGASAYISPSWYPSKAFHHKVVPTYNYTAVHCQGRMRIFDDSAWILSLLHDLTLQQEDARPQPWRPQDAPPDFLAANLKAIVGIEIAIEQITGKFKVSQNKQGADLHGVIQGLNEAGQADMAHLVASHSKQAA